MINEEEVNFVADLANIDPDLATMLDEHVRYHEEVVPYVFMGDLARWAVARWQSRDLDQLDRLLFWLDGRFATADDEIQNLVAVGFLENLPPTIDVENNIRRRLGPRLAAEFERVNY
jgi:hypothetical protein